LNVVLEHWFKVFTGAASWRSPNFFFPQPATLGYSETLFLCALPYSVLRLLGVDLYSAFQIVVIGLTALGYTAMYVLLDRGLGCQPLVAAFVAGLFAFSSQLTTHIGHPHVLTTAFVPILVYCALAYLDPRKDRASALLHGLVGAVLLALFSYTCFNVAWFVVLFALLLGLVGAALTLALGSRPERIVAEIWRCRTDALTFALVFLLFLIPFLVTFLPVRHDLGGRRFDAVTGTIPSPLDLINVGEANAVWGRLVAAIVPQDRGAPSGLFTLGSPPLFLLC